MTTTYWLVIGFIGQIAFGARFVIQWVISEKKGESTIPLAFWYCSIAGKCYSANVCNPQRRPGFYSWTKSRFDYLHPQLNSY